MARFFFEIPDFEFFGKKVEEVEMTTTTTRPVPRAIARAAELRREQRQAAAHVFLGLRRRLDGVRQLITSGRADAAAFELGELVDALDGWLSSRSGSNDH